jgi:O-antigen ligase
MNRIVSNKWPGGMNTLDMTLLFAVMTMPFNYLWNSYPIVLFVAASVLSTSTTVKLERLRQRAFFWILPLTYFVWMTISLLWDTGDFSFISSVKDLERSVSWVVFPLLFATIDNIDPKSIRKILLAFVVSNLFASFYCLWEAYLDYKSTNYINVFFYHRLSEHINISAIYFSLYCVFCIYILLYYFIFKKQEVWIRLACLAATGYLTFFVIVLSSKTMIFLLYISALFFAVYSFYYFRSKWGTLIFSVLLVAMPVLLIKFPYVNSRVRDTHIKEYSGSIDNQNGLAVRGVLWESAWDLIRERPMLGWGHNGAQVLLQKKYLQSGFSVGVKENYNSHDQYLYTWLCYGLLALTILLIYAGNLLFFFSREGNFLGICMMLLFIFANVTECMLEVQKGIVFFFLFGNLFLFHMGREAGNQQGEVSLSV